MSSGEEYNDDGFDMDASMDQVDQEPVRGTSSSKPSAGAESKSVRFGTGRTAQSAASKNKTNARPGSTPASMLKKPGSKSKTEQSSQESKQAATRKEAERLLQEEREAQARRAMTMDQIKSTSKSNKHIIYKFVKKGFAALSAEELACTMVNPTFSIDFKENTGDDWNI